MVRFFLVLISLFTWLTWQSGEVHSTNMVQVQRSDLLHALLESEKMVGHV